MHPERKRAFPFVDEGLMSPSHLVPGRHWRCGAVVRFGGMLDGSAAGYEPDWMDLLHFLPKRLY